MTDSPPLPSAAGWYPDPWARAPLRWFDGTAWTGHTHDGGPAAAGAATAAAPLERGKPVRAVIDAATALLARGDAVARQLAGRREQAAGRVDGARADEVEAALAAIPVAQLRGAGGGLRLAAIEAAGYRTVADLARTTGRQLEAVPGVGPQTASAVMTAVVEVRSAVGAGVPVRLDPDRKDAADTAVLEALWALDVARAPVEAAITALRAVRGELERLVPASAEAGAGRLAGLLISASRKQKALAAATELRDVVGSPAAAAARDAIGAAEASLAMRPPRAEALWADFEARAAHWNAVLASVGAGTAPAGSVTGHLPEDIARRVEAHPLDLSLVKATLRGYQAFGARFALAQGRSMLGDEMGLGKTVQALAAMAHLTATGSTHFLVVCPASVLVNWSNEIARHTALASVRLHGDDRHEDRSRWIAEGGVAVTTFESLHTIEPPGELVAMLVVDEAHYAKNPETRRSKAVQAWANSAERVLFMTGTPMENRVEEFRTLVRYLQPQVAATVSGADGLAGAAAFRRAVAPAYLRREQVDVLSELPDKLEAEDWVELSPDDQAAYREAVSSGNFMSMRRAAYATPAAAAEPDRSAKLARLLDIVEESEANTWKVVVFSFFLDVLDRTAAALQARGTAVFGPLTGATSPVDRQALVDRFGAHDGPAVLISQIQAGGVGLNMQAASVVVLTEPQWKPSTERQAIGRAHRMGQVRRVHVHRLLATDSVDQLMLEVLRTKQALFDEYVPSEVADASAAAVDPTSPTPTEPPADEPPTPTQAAAERAILESERARLGLPGPPT